MSRAEIATRAPLHDGVVERLRQMIIRCELKPGERLAEQDLGTIFGVSRTPLREALKLLAAEGLVEIRPHKGAIIADISLEEIADTFDVMSALEAMAGPLICERISNKNLAELTAIVEAMDACHDSNDIGEYFSLNRLFHLSVIQLSGNRVLLRTYEEHFGKLQRARYLVNSNHERWQESSAEHQWILEALKSRDHRSGT